MPHGVNVRSNLPAFRYHLRNVVGRNPKTIRLTVIGEYVDYAAERAVFVCKAEKRPEADPNLSVSPYAIVFHFDANGYADRLGTPGPLNPSDMDHQDPIRESAERALAASISSFVLNPETCRLLMPHVVKHCNIVEVIGQIDKDPKEPTCPTV